MCVRVAGAVAAALALAACGNSRQEDLRDQYRAACEGLAPGTTLRDTTIALRFRYAILPPNCRTDWAELAVDQCADPPAQACSIIYEFLLTDPGLCGAAVGTPCADYCEVRVTGPTNDLDTPICARQYLTRQVLF